MRMYDLIMKKRKGEELTTEEINFFVDGFTKGEIPDYQASAMLMAIFFNKMNKRETADLTNAMVESGDKIDLSNPTMDNFGYKYIHYIHIYGDEGLKVSIYFDVDSLVRLSQKFPYYELYDMNDVERFLATDEDEAVLFNTVKKLI